MRDLRAEFASREGAVEAVRGVSFGLRRGEKIGIVGESGCGKSTMALALLGLLELPGRVTGGQVLLNGRDLVHRGDRELSRRRGREISLVVQDPMLALDPVKPIGEQLIEGIRRHQPRRGRRGARALARQLLRDVELPNADRRLDDYPHQYSGGMRQRVVIAIALANEPDVLIADEPTTALDVTTQAQVLEVLDRLVSDRGTAVVFITHNMGVISEFCDRVLVMYAGKIVEEGEIRPVFRHTLHPYTEALLQCIPSAQRRGKDRLPSISGSPPNLALLPRGCSFEPRCPVGHGHPDCISIQPGRIAVRLDGAKVIAECHFAEERAFRKATSAGG